MRPALIGVIAAGFLAVAGASHAQQPTAGATTPSGAAIVEDLTVRGHRTEKPPPSFSSAVDSYVRSRAQASPVGNLSRWNIPVCPYTAGLDPAYDAFVNKRLMQVAAEVGAPGPGHCKTTNVLVVFTSEPQKLVDNVRTEHPKLLGYHYHADEKAISTFQGPMEAWHVTGTRGLKGILSRDEADPPCDAPSCPLGTGQVGDANSRLANGLSNEFMFVLVVVKADQVDGQPIGTVADQIATLVLSDPGRRRGCSPLPSVMDALDPNCPADAQVATLTAYDEAYLKGLYATNPENLIDVQRTSIGHSLRQATRPPATVAR